MITSLEERTYRKDDSWSENNCINNIMVKNKKDNKRGWEGKFWEDLSTFISSQL